jgi:hypothetical protein
MQLFNDEDAARVLELAGDSIWSNIQWFKGDPRGKDVPRCKVCGTADNLFTDYGYDGPFRCNSLDCVPY